MDPTGRKEWWETGNFHLKQERTNMFELQIFEKPDLIFYQGGYWAKAKLEMSISGFDVLKDLFLKLRRKKVLSYMQKKSF